MEERIEEFIGEHHLLTFAAAGGADIWCASAFYAWCPKEQAFIITSDGSTRHIRLALESGNGEIAGNIALETESVGLIRGLQFKARLIQAGDGGFFGKYRTLYLKRFPYAVLKGGEVWILKVMEAKFTDNRLCFGKKLYWRRGDEDTPSAS